MTVGDIIAPHDILDRILSASFPSHTILSKPGSYFTEKSRRENRIISCIYQLKHHLACFVRLLRHHHARYVFREYDGFSFLYLFLPVSADIKFNVNHNLATWHGRAVTRLLSKRFDILFIDPSEQLLKRYGYLQRVSSSGVIKPNVEFGSWDKRSILLFCGSRADQLNYGRGELVNFASALISAGYSVTVLGKNHPQGAYLPETEYLPLVEKSLAVCTCAYRTNRHSGTLWTLKEYAPAVLFNSSECGSEQLKGHSRHYSFDELAEAMRLIEELTVR